MRIVVSDSSCLIDLRKASLIETFLRLPYEFLIPNKGKKSLDSPLLGSIRSVGSPRAVIGIDGFWSLRDLIPSA